MLVNDTLFESNAALATGTVYNGAPHPVGPECFSYALFAVFPAAGITFGGAISSIGFALASNCVFRNNTASVAGSGQGQGGALLAATVAQITSSLFELNVVAAYNPSQTGMCAFLSANLLVHYTRLLPTSSYVVHQFRRGIWRCRELCR